MMAKIFFYVVGFLCQTKILLLNMLKLSEISGIVSDFVQIFRLFKKFLKFLVFKPKLANYTSRNFDNPDKMIKIYGSNKNVCYYFISSLKPNTL